MVQIIVFLCADIYRVVGMLSPDSCMTQVLVWNMPIFKTIQWRHGTDKSFSCFCSCSGCCIHTNH